MMYRINLELTRPNKRGLDIWLSKGNELIPVYHMEYEDIIPYIEENSRRIMSYDEIVFINHIPQMINEYFDGHKYETIDSFFRVFFDDVISKELKHIFQEEHIRINPAGKCPVKLRFRKSFGTEVANVLKL